MKHLLLIGCLLAILFTLSPLFTMQPYADDFTVQPSIQGDAWRFMVNGYYTWTGRWAFYLLYGVAGQLPIWAWGWTVLGFIGVWWIALYHIARHYAPDLALPGASLLLLIALQVISAKREVLWWLSGFYTYGIAIILASWLVVLWFAKHTVLNIALLLTGIFILPGMNETAGLLQIVVWCGLLYWQYHRHHSLRLALWALFIAIVSYVLIFFAPGNAIREAQFTQPGLLPALQYTFYAVGFIPARMVTQVPLAVLGALSLALINRPRRREADKALVWLLVGIGLCWFSFFISYYATGYLLAERAWSMAQIGFLFCLANAIRDASPRRKVEVR